MASDIDNIRQELTRRFNETPEYPYKRRIIFWYDEEREFEDEIDNLYIPGVKILHLTGKNTFAAKKTLCEDDTESNYLVYNPLSFETPDDNWLINVELYSEDFRADQISIWLDEMAMPSTPSNRKLVKDYRKFFNNKDRRQSVKSLNLSYKNPSQIPLAVMAVLSGRKDINASGIIKAVVSNNFDAEENTIYQSFVSYGIDTAFWSMVKQATGFNKGEDVSLSNLVIHILLTASTNTLDTELLEGLDRFISTSNQPFCYDLVFGWLHSDDKAAIYELARFTERELKLSQRFKDIDAARLVSTEIFPCIDECILSTLMTEITEHEVINVSQIKSVVERRRTMAWFDDYECYYNGLYHLANMQDFFLEHSDGFHFVDAKEIWDAYKKDYYLMDTYYRYFQMNFQKSLSDSHPLLEDLFKHVSDTVEGLYINWFLNKLAENWTKTSEENFRNNGKFIYADGQQTNFYSSKVKNSKNKVFVIISDALRYEVAVELAQRLNHETQSKTEVDAYAGIFPAVTKYGMAALLPHNGITVEKKAKGGFEVLIDGMSSDGVDNRDKILKQANPNSVALQYSNIIGKKKPERQALIRGMDVVYIYHDRIDDTGHHNEPDVFAACEETIKEIINLVKIIIFDFGSTNIYITSDHGFLYTYSPLEEYSKVDKKDFADDIVELDRRYVVTTKDSEPEELMPIRFLNGKTDYNAFTPRENLRIKKSGSGINYVHGGVSLQEYMIPVIEYHYFRNQYKDKDKFEKKPVELILLATIHKVNNMIFTLKFGQRQVIGGNIEAATYNIYFEDEYKNKVSDVQKIIADKTTENEQERTFSCRFSLKSQSYSNTAKYYLVIEDESGLQIPQRIEFNIDIAFAIDDFNFSLD